MNPKAVCCNKDTLFNEFKLQQMEKSAPRNSIILSTTKTACCTSDIPLLLKKGSCRCSANVKLRMPAMIKVGRKGKKASGKSKPVKQVASQ